MYSKPLMVAALVTSFGASAMNPAYAQGLPPDDGGFEIETAEDSTSSDGFVENLSQYVGATLGANTGTSDASDKTIQAMSFVFDLPRVGNVKSALSVDVGSYENVYTLEISNNSQQQLQQCQELGLQPKLSNNDNVDPLPAYGNITQQELYSGLECGRVVDDNDEWFAPTIERTVENSFTELTEGYIQWEPTSFATLRAGRQPIVLGQFEVFSPLMFTTPLKTTGTKTKTTKADKAFAQDGVQISLFPTSNFELSVTSVPEMRIDKANQDRFESFAALKGDFINFMPTADSSGGQVDQVDTLRDISENDLSVVRAMYYGDRLTFGLTQIEGAETNEDPLREANLAPVACNEFFANDTAPAGSTCAEGNTGGSYDEARGPEVDPGFNTYALDDDEGLRFAEIEATAIELSYRVSDRWTFILERTLVEGEMELDALPEGGRYGEVPTNFRTRESLLPIYAELVTDNNAKPYINVETIMQGIGMVYKGDRWLLNLQVVNRTQEGASAQEEAWRKALSREVMEGEEESDDTLPILNAVRLLGDEKQGYAGFGFGSFGQGFGIGISAGWRYFEKLEVGFFGGMALDVTGAEEIETEGYESPEGEGYASFGINYLF